MKRTIAKVGVAGLVLLGVTECHMITAPAVIADEHSAQTLKIEHKPLNMFDVMVPKEFERLEVSIQENVNPWLDPEQANSSMSQSDVKTILQMVGFSGYALRMAQAIVSLESTNRIYAHNQNHRTGDNSYGLFQINMFKGLEEARLKEFDLERNEDLFDPFINAAIAYKISNGGKNWSAWTTYPKAQLIVNRFSG